MKVRLNLNMTSTAMDRLDRLVRRSEAENMTEVIRRALATYETLLEYRDRDGRIVFRGRDGTEYELLVA